MGFAGAAEARPRVAITEFVVEGDRTPAIDLQLQDGFVLALVRDGIHVMDPADVERRIQDAPELRGCETSPCLKSLGRLLDVRHVVRVRIDVSGNSYKLVARVWETEGAAPAALPLDTKSRACDVCTIAEARDAMFRLADAVKPRFAEPAPPPAPPPPPPPPGRAGPLLAIAASGLAVVGGLALYATAHECSAVSPDTCDGQRLRAAAAGVLVGAGIAVGAVAATVSVTRSRATTVAVAWSF